MTRYEWTDHPANPLIEPPRPEWLLGDPVVCTPDKAPDGRWHMMANTLRGIHRFVSPDGVAWGLAQWKVTAGMRAFLLYEDGYRLFYEHYLKPWRSRIETRRSDDLKTWSEPTVVLEPDLPWEMGRMKTTGSPCVVRLDDGRYRLYYNANIVFLPDCKFPEPLHFGVAEADRPEGPYVKRPEPILSPDAEVPWRNMGAGSMKVYREGTEWIAYTNGIYKDAEGRSRSDVRRMTSPDGIDWRYDGNEAIAAPEPGWKNALVYAMDVVAVGDERWMYYTTPETGGSGASSGSG